MSVAVKERQDETIAWGFKQCAENRFSTEAPPFVIVDRRLKLLQGKTIIPSGERLTYAGLTGDLNMFALDFELPYHHNKFEISMITKAAKGGMYNFADPRPDAAWASTTRCMTDWFCYLDDNGIALPKLAEIPGFHVQSFYEDQLHVDALGLRQHACGSALRDLAYESAFGSSMDGAGTWQDKLDLCLHGATREFRAWQASERVSCTQPAFKSLALSLKRQDDFPVLKSKGRNCLYVSEWLLHKCDALYRANPTWRAQQRFAFFWGLHGIWDVAHRVRPRFELTDSEAAELEQKRLCGLMAFYSLNLDSSTTTRPGYNIIPKFIFVDMMARRAVRTKVSHHLFWTFRTEHHMGHIAKIMNKTHGASSKKRVIERWLVSFWLWLNEECDDASLVPS